MSATLLDIRKITYSEFRQMEFDDNDTFLYELINGTLIKKRLTSLFINVFQVIYLANYTNLSKKTRLEKPFADQLMFF